MPGIVSPERRLSEIHYVDLRLLYLQEAMSGLLHSALPRRFKVIDGGWSSVLLGDEISFPRSGFTGQKLPTGVRGAMYEGPALGVQIHASPDIRVRVQGLFVPGNPHVPNKPEKVVLALLAAHKPYGRDDEQWRLMSLEELRSPYLDLAWMRQNRGGEEDTLGAGFVREYAGVVVGGVNHFIGQMNNHEGNFSRIPPVRLEQIGYSLH